MKVTKAREIFGLLMLGGLIQGCGASSEAPTAAPLGTSLSAVMSTASTKLAEAVPGVAASAVSLRKQKLNKGQINFLTQSDMTAAQFSTSLNVGALNYFTTPATLVDYIIEKDADVDPTDGMGLINRFKQKIISGMCPIMNMFPDANGNGIPDVGTGTLTVPDFTSATVVAAFEAVCPGVNTANLVQASGRQVAYTVEDVSASTGSLYDIKVQISMGGGANIFYYRADGKVMRFVFMEADGTAASDGAEFAFFEYDGTTMKFEMYSGHQDGHYRMLYNSSTKDITLYAHLMNGANSPTKRVYMALVGNRATSVAALTLSGDATAYGGDTVTNAQACVDVSGSSSAWSSAPVSGKCGTIDAIDFSTEPAAATAAYSYAGTVANMGVTYQALFTTRGEVFSKAIF